MLNGLRARVAELDPAVRQTLAERWSDAALAEHASVASFSRFSLQLLAVGAPPDLLRAAHQAALDEIRHAAVCFSIASVFHGTAVGPGALDLSGDVLGPTDLRSIVRSAFAEGCVGETLAALEAQHAADAAEPESIRSALREIAADEQRHAELAWAFVAWALRTGGSDVTDVITDVMTGIAEPVVPTPDPLAQQIAPYGCVGGAARARIQVEGLREVVRPTVAALLGT